MAKSIFKKMFLMLTVGLTSATVLGQSIKDYYIPDTNYNKASFFTPGKSGERTDMTRVIYYTDNGDGTYDILNSYMFKGQPASIVTRTVQFTTSEVKMIKSITTNMMHTNEKENYDPPRTLLKIPPIGQTVTWSIIEAAGDKPTKFIASWTNVTVNGESRKAIKVVSQNPELINTKAIYYYVKGVGLMATDISGNGTTKPFDKFDGLSYEAEKR